MVMLFLIGKNNRQNDYLTLRLAQNDDIWLHTQNIPGSMLLSGVRTANRRPKTLLLQAAHLAAYYSWAAPRPMFQWTTTDAAR